MDINNIGYSHLKPNGQITNQNNQNNLDLNFSNYTNIQAQEIIFAAMKFIEENTPIKDENIEEINKINEEEINRVKQSIKNSLNPINGYSTHNLLVSKNSD